jgi:hypothetical protein
MVCDLTSIENADPDARLDRDTTEPQPPGNRCCAMSRARANYDEGWFKSGVVFTPSGIERLTLNFNKTVRTWR